MIRIITQKIIARRIVRKKITLFATLLLVAHSMFCNDLNFYQNQIVKNPKDWKALYNTGVVAFLEGDFVQAEAAFNFLKPIAQQQHWQTDELIKIFYNGGNSEFKLKKYNEAIESFEIVLEHDHENEKVKEKIKYIKELLKEQSSQESNESNKEKQQTADQDNLDKDKSGQDKSQQEKSDKDKSAEEESDQDKSDQKQPNSDKKSDYSDKESDQKESDQNNSDQKESDQNNSDKNKSDQPDKKSGVDQEPTSDDKDAGHSDKEKGDSDSTSPPKEASKNKPVDKEWSSKEQGASQDKEGPELSKQEQFILDQLGRLDQQVNKDLMKKRLLAVGGGDAKNNW